MTGVFRAHRGLPLRDGGDRRDVMINRPSEGRRIDPRGQPGPIAWANAFKALLEVRGVEKGGRGGDRRSEGFKVTSCLFETGVSPATAYKRMLRARRADEAGISAVEQRRHHNRHGHREA